ncbi:MAG: hypothetical protein HYZ57_14285 [Acidobacteria bacterium]|nr:hypothetical protein [Acidobacteriota bacterium]MBI3281000.1 hypothetical protein [Acidobacteriota bacterium]
MRTATLLLLSSCCTLLAETVPFDASAVRPGPVTIEQTAAAVVVRWPDETGRTWRAEFSLDPSKPLITSIATGSARVIDRAQPLYWAATGKRRGGWDQFFDFPPSHPEGTRSFTGRLQLTSARARSLGERVELTFEGLQLGIFAGSVRYTFYPGSRLLQQEAVAATSEPDTAYYYDAGLRITADADRRAGGNMESEITYYDTSGRLRTVASSGPERIPIAVRHRALAARMAGGSVAVFPAPHQYFMPRDFTTNLSHLWHCAWRGTLSLGIRQLPDDFTRFYPWMNAPAGSEQRMGVFFLLSDKAAPETLAQVLRYTNADRFSPLSGYRTMSVHWHFAYTVQAMEKGFTWTPPFTRVLRQMGVDASIIMDFHGDGHPRDTTDLRLQELAAFYQACRAQSGRDFLLIPGEEANVHFGGHWSVMFPKPVLWMMSRPPGANSAARIQNSELSTGPATPPNCLISCAVKAVTPTRPIRAPRARWASPTRFARPSTSATRAISAPAGRR